MNNLSITNDIIPVGQFKAELAKYLKDIRSRKNPLIITQNGRPAGVLVSPEEYDDMLYTKRLIESIARGLEDSEKGNTYSTEELKEKLGLNRK